MWNLKLMYNSITFQIKVNINNKYYLKICKHLYKLFRLFGKCVMFRICFVCRHINVREICNIDLSRACYRHVSVILHVSIDLSQFKEFRVVIISRCLVPLITVIIIFLVMQMIFYCPVLP